MTPNYTRKILTVLLLSVAVTSSVFAQNSDNGSVTIIGSRFSYPYIRELISDFKQQYPTVEIQLLERGTDTEDNANLIINGHDLLVSEIRTGYRVVNIAQYPILPVSNIQNPWLNQVLTSGIDKKEIKALFFNKDYDGIYDEKKEKAEKPASTPDLHLYTRDQKACAPNSFAAFYELKQENLLGKRIIGSDLSLLFAVKADPKGVTYNLPTHLYNLESRLPLSDWKIIPIDQNGNNSLEDDELIYDKLDELLEAIAAKDVQNIPIANLNISLPLEITSANKNLALFVDFLLSSGQKKARKYGFVELESDKAEKQRSLITNKL